MFDPNPQSIAFYLSNLDHEARPATGIQRTRSPLTDQTMRVISVIGLLTLAAMILPIA